MNLRANCKRIALKILVVALASVATYGAGPHSPRNKTNETDALASRLLEKFTEADKKGIVIMDLQPAFGRPGSFGPWFADQLSSSLTRHGQIVKVIDRLRLGTAVEPQHLSPNDES